MRNIATPIFCGYSAAVDRAADNWIAKRSLFNGRLFEIAHVVCRLAPELRHDIAYAGLNVLALPPAGVFSDGGMSSLRSTTPYSSPGVTASRMS